MNTRALGPGGWPLAFSLLAIGTVTAMGLSMLGLPTILWSAGGIGCAAMLANGAGNYRVGRLLLTGAVALALLWLAVFTFVPTLAFAASDGVVDLNPAADALREVLNDMLYGVLMIATLYVSMQIKKWTGVDISRQVLDIEAKHRGTLHSALETWTKSAMAKFGPDLEFKVGNPGLEYILDGVASSAADAVDHLQPTTDWLIAKAAGVAGVTVPVVNVAGKL